MNRTVGAKPWSPFLVALVSALTAAAFGRPPAPPPFSRFALFEQVLSPGYGYLYVSDGTALAYQLLLPDPDSGVTARIPSSSTIRATSRRCASTTAWTGNFCPGVMQ